MTAGYLRQQRERFEPSVVLEDGISFEGFCEAEVERMGVEADEPQVPPLPLPLPLALTLALALTPAPTPTPYPLPLYPLPPTLPLTPNP